MGLDNGITIKKTDKTKLLGLDDYFDDDGFNELEVCYWRKCWGLRGDILLYLQTRYKNKEEKFCYELDADDIKVIINIIKNWQNKKKWNEEGNSIWNYKDIEENLMQDRENLAYLLATMKIMQNNIITVEFYDSY